MAVQLNVISFVAEDMARSLAFYHRLGLELPPELDGEPHAEATLPSLGYEGERAPWDAIWGQRYAVVRDPDGNGIDLFVPLS